LTGLTSNNPFTLGAASTGLASATSTSVTLSNAPVNPGLSFTSLNGTSGATATDSTPYGISYALVTTSTDSGVVTYVVSSAGTAGCAISGGNQVTFTNVGSCAVTASVPAQTGYSSGTATLSLTVTVGDPAITFNNGFNNGFDTTDTVTFGDPLQVNYDASAFSQSSNPIQYSPTGCSVNASGLASGFTDGGTCTVTASVAADGYYASSSEVFTLVVNPDTASAQTSTISASPVSITANGVSTSIITVQLEDSIGNQILASDGAVSISSNLGTVIAATDNGDGTYTATLTSLTSGTATISATLDLVALTQTTSVTMAAGSASVSNSTITTSSTSVTADGASSATITVQLKDANGNNLSASGGTIVLTSSLGPVSSVTDHGNGTYSATVSSSTAGSATISATLNDAALTHDVAVTFVAGPVDPGLSFSTHGTSGAAATDSVQFGNTYTISASDQSSAPISYVVTNAGSAGCSVASGVVSFTSVGTCVITAAAASITNYLSGTATLTLTVTGANPNLHFTNGVSTANAGDTYTPTISASSTGTITYSVSGCSMASGVISFANVGTCVITASIPAQGNYAASSTTLTVVVSTPSGGNILSTNSINFSSSPPTSGVVGNSYTVSASASSGGSVAFSVDPSSTLVCSLANGDVVTFLSDGTCVIDASAPATSLFKSGTNSQPIIVVNALVISAPSGITVVPGDSQAAVSWSAPLNASSFAGVTYQVTASPGGTTCSTTSANGCLITGLVDGVNYTFTVTVTSSGPVSVTTSAPSAVATPSSAPSTLGTIGNTELTPGVGQITQSNGVTLTPTVTTTTDSVSVSTGTSSVMIQTGSTVGSGNTSTVSMSTGSTVAFSGSGFLPGTVVDIYIFSAGTLLGTAIVKADGTYSANLLVPVTLATGNHTAVVQGFITAQSLTSFQVGVTVSGTGSPWMAQSITWSAPGAQTWSAGGAGTFSLGGASVPSGSTVTFASSTTSVCTVSGTLVTMLTPGTCTITPTALSYYATFVGSASNITINPATQSITLALSGPTNPVVGDTNTVSATAPGGPVSLSLGTTSTGCTLSGTTVTFNALGTCTIYAFTPGTANFRGTTSSQSITVGPLVVAAPAQISATVGDRQAVVSWSTPKNVSRFSGVIAVVEASPGGATCSTSSANWCLVTGLLDGVSYTFTVTLISSGPTSVTTSIPSSVATPTSVVTELAGGSQLNPGVGQIQRSDGTTSIPSVSTTAKSVTLTSGGASVTIQTASTIGSGKATTVALVAGRTASFSGMGFIPGTIVDLYIYSPQTLLGTAVVQPDGTYAVTIAFPTPLATGNYTAMVEGFASAQQSLTSFAVGVVVPPAPSLTLTLTHFSSKTMKLTSSMRTQIAKFVQALIIEGSVSISVTGFSDSHGTKAQNLARGRSRATSVSNYLTQQLIALAYADALVTPVKTLGQAKPTKSNATATGRAANRRVVIVVTLT